MTMNLCMIYMYDIYELFHKKNKFINNCKNSSKKIKL